MRTMPKRNRNETKRRKRVMRKNNERNLCSLRLVCLLLLWHGLPRGAGDSAGSLWWAAPLAFLGRRSELRLVGVLGAGCGRKPFTGGLIPGCGDGSCDGVGGFRVIHWAAKPLPVRCWPGPYQQQQQQQQQQHQQQQQKQQTGNWKVFSQQVSLTTIIL